MWKVVAEPKGENPGVIKKAAAAAGREPDPTPENIGGMVIYVTDGGEKREISRVAYIRRDTTCRNPEVDYQVQLDKEMEKAQKTADTLNELLTQPSAPGEAQ